MKIEVYAPDSDNEFCNGCDCLSFNHYDVSQLNPVLHVYCRKLKTVFESKSLEVKKHHDCPTLKLEVFEDGKPKSLHRTVSTGSAKENTAVKKTEVLW